MPASISLHRSLRKVPDFRHLSEKDLNAIVSQMVVKEYTAGEVLWRTKTHLDLLGIIQQGEIVLERKINKTAVRTVKLSAGDIVLPRAFRGNGRSSVLVRAVTDVRICVLHMDRIESRFKKRDSTARTLPRLQRVVLYTLWTALLALIIIMVSWQDMRRVLSGLLYLQTGQVDQPVYDPQRSMELLTYAETVDRSAAFAHNQEGFLRYQGNDLQNARMAFARAVNIDQANGPSLNNLAVTYFDSGQIQQAAASQQEAVQYDPNNAIVHYNLGLILTEQNNNKEAIREFREATYIDPAWMLPYLHLGFNYLQIHDFDNAEKAATNAIKLDPGQQSAHMILAIALYNQNRDRDALMSVQRALQLDPANRSAMFYKALILNELKEFDSALSILEQLLGSANDPGQILRINIEIEATHRFMQSHQGDDQ